VEYLKAFHRAGVTSDGGSILWVLTGGGVLAVQGTSHGEHRDGPWRAGDPEHGTGRCPWLADQRS
jgi:hypothetical protein